MLGVHLLHHVLVLHGSVLSSDPVGLVVRHLLVALGVLAVEESLDCVHKTQGRVRVVAARW